MIRLLAQVLNGVTEYDFNALIAELKLFSTVLSMILALALAYIVYKLRAVIRQDLQLIGSEINPPTEPVSAYDARWQEIKQHLNSINNSEWKFAIVEADKLTDDVLKAAGFVGESMGERLISIEPGQLASLDKLWRAHKIRNLLVHDANFDLRRSTALEAIDGFEAAIRELGGID